jgi:hypothetical protein
VPHNATPVLDDGGKMASPAEVGHWRLKGSKTPLGASRIEPCQLSGQQLRRYFGLGLGALMQRAPARGRGAGGKRPHDVASLPEAKPASPLNCGDFPEGQTCDRKRASGSMPAQCSGSATLSAPCGQPTSGRV